MMTFIGESLNKHAQEFEIFTVIIIQVCFLLLFLFNNFLLLFNN